MDEMSGYQRSEAEMRSFVRNDAERIFGKPVSEWDGMDFAFFTVSKPYALDEALNVALEMGHREGVGAIAAAAHIAGENISRLGPHQDMEAARQYATVCERIANEPKT